MDESGADNEEELTVVVIVATVVSEFNDDDADTTALETRHGHAQSACHRRET
jgi:hypothetical protein